MSDYIKREDAIAIAWCYVDDRDAIYDLIRLPKADVVEVVRCADCKWFQPINNGDHGYCGTPFHGAEVYEDDYCSDGET